MFKLMSKEGRSMPLLFCDACGKQIEDGHLAGAVYKVVGPDKESDVLFAHKGACMDTLEESLGEAYDGWDELDRYLAFITNNVKLKPEDLEEALDFHRETGM